MNISEWIVIAVFIAGIFFLKQFLNKRYLSKLDPDKVEGVKLIMFAFLLGIFYTKALESTGGIGFVIVLAVLTGNFIYGSYKWMKGSWRHKEQES